MSYYFNFDINTIYSFRLWLGVALKLLMHSVHCTHGYFGKNFEQFFSQLEQQCMAKKQLFYTVFELMQFLLQNGMLKIYTKISQCV